MDSHLPVTNDDGEAGDLSEVGPAVFKPFSERSAALQPKLRGRPKAAATKEPVKIRLDSDVLQALRATGDGWQTRINGTLRASLQLGGRLDA